MRIKDLVAGQEYALERRWMSSRVRIVNGTAVQAPNSWRHSSPRNSVEVVMVDHPEQPTRTVLAREIKRTWAEEVVLNAKADADEAARDVAKAADRTERLADMACVIRKVGAVKSLDIREIAYMVKQTEVGTMSDEANDAGVAKFLVDAGLTVDADGDVEQEDKVYGVIVNDYRTSFALTDALTVRLLNGMAILAGEPLLTALDALEAN